MNEYLIITIIAILVIVFCRYLEKLQMWYDKIQREEEETKL